jgi:hypothetical protein
VSDMRKLDHIERERTYHYPDGSKQHFTNVVAVGVTKSGFHRLEDDGGLKFIVAPGWRFISLNTDEWSF